MKKFFIFFTLLFLTISIGFPEKNNETTLYKYEKESEMNIEKYVVVPIVGVTLIEEMPNGVLGNLKIGILTNNSNQKIIFDEKTNLNETTIKSILDAINFVENKYGVKKNYFIRYNLSADLISGCSSGSSIALALMSLLENKTLKEDVLITGAIDNNGNLLPTGGLLFKINSAEKNNFSLMLIPKGQGKILVKQNNNLFKEKPINSKIKLIEIENIQTIDLNLIFTS